MDIENDLPEKEKLRFEVNLTEDMVKDILYHNAVKYTERTGRPYDLSTPQISTNQTTTKDEHFIIEVPKENIDELYCKLKGVYIPESEESRILLHKIFTLQPLADNEKLLWIDQTKTGPSNLTMFYFANSLVDIQGSSRHTIFDFIRQNFDCVSKTKQSGRQPFNIPALRISRRNYERGLEAGKRQPSPKVEALKKICNEVKS